MLQEKMNTCPAGKNGIEREILKTEMLALVTN